MLPHIVLNPACGRADTEIMDSRDRPGDAEYDRYAYLGKPNRSDGGEHEPAALE
jgi:hypothetical protein